MNVRNLIIRTGLTLGVLYMVAIAGLIYLDEEVYEFDKSLMLVHGGGIHIYTKDVDRVYDLPDHKVLIVDGKLHLYPKAIAYQVMSEEQMKELE